MNTSVILLSGGIDSTVLLHKLVKEDNESPLAISFKYGQRHSIEVHCAQLQAAALNVIYKVVDLTQIFQDFHSALCGTREEVPDTVDILGDAQPIVYIPWRNAIFLTIALGIAESHNIPKIYYGAQQNDSYQFFDTTPEFVQLMNNLACMNRKHSCEIVASLVSLPKKDVVKKGLELGVDFSKVMTCYNPTSNGLGIRACGRCPSCTQRLKAFKELNTEDPFRYKKTCIT
jgi:7-cyano-7-deazaguanine synthase